MIRTSLKLWQIPNLVGKPLYLLVQNRNDFKFLCAQDVASLEREARELKDSFTCFSPYKFFLTFPLLRQARSRRLIQKD